MIHCLSLEDESIDNASERSPKIHNGAYRNLRIGNKSQHGFMQLAMQAASHIALLLWVIIFKDTCHDSLNRF